MEGERGTEHTTTVLLGYGPTVLQCHGILWITHIPLRQGDMGQGDEVQRGKGR